MKRYHISFHCLIFLLYVMGYTPSVFANSYYEAGYEMEQLNTLFAIPLYEKALTEKPSGKLQKAVVSRLFFLYKKHGKLLDALFLGSKYPNLIPTKERSWIWTNLAEIYRPISVSELSSTYVLASKSSPEKYLELSEHLKNAASQKLYEFASIILLKRKQYKAILSIYAENPGMVKTPLFIGISEFKIGADSGKEFLKTILGDTDRERTDQEKSDVLYLMGVYYRQTADYDLSARYFRMSGSFGSKPRGDLETTKSLVLKGNSKEMCSTFKFTISSSDEIETLLNFYCSPNANSSWKPYEPSIRILAEREGNEFLTLLFPGIN
ncbi:hypothetical protein ND861_16805 [Leptospira sp. 2 VSF19]|uniref:Tetratricopeptide repeat protein n=1 Tax=Leptospira soteropolitanensis TaxID=2950025 RepID=A0AAW5VT68_9LEPT|nr:hypothetical protein [Leptospira soteropolitanensis]MCW7494309.1 hypothetical protein [Leptospira soteropolitanensis]MCW7501982.1 hypothetical protein [Leptospira soteropolitanensis]MCW7524155.1 hypothetical protein [Leptospira soteropolitanensis]MCW7528020.1 hypothetical protein [Leptospira soteropolitanensis]MCW7531874.1 hypothetical protein [Leptospira soteropolitanensis]